MADNRTIEYKLVVDATTGNKSIVDTQGNVVELEKAVKSMNDNSQKSFDASIAKIRDLSLAYDGVKNAIGQIASTFQAFITEAEVARKAGNQLDIVLKSVGAADMAKSIKAYADSLQEAGIMEGDAAVKAAAMGLQMGISTDKIKDATNGAIGLSSAYGIDVAQAMKLVAGGMQGNYDMLGRLNPAIRVAKDESEKAAIFQTMLADGFKLAESEGKTFTGAMQKLNDKIGDAKEVIGGFLTNILLPVVEVIGNHAPVAIGVVIGSLVAMVAPVYTLVTAVTALSGAVTAATGGLNLLIAAGVALGVSGVAYVATMDNSTTATEKNTEATKKNVDAKKELTQSEQSFIDDVKKIQNDLLTENEKSVKAEEDKLKKIQELRAEYGETFRGSGQKLAEIEELARLEQLQTEKLQAVKNEANQETKAEQEKLNADMLKAENELFQERMGIENDLTAQQQAEYEKRTTNAKQAAADKQAAEDEVLMNQINKEYEAAQFIKSIDDELNESKRTAYESRFVEIDEQNARSMEQLNQYFTANLISEKQFTESKVKLAEFEKVQKGKVAKDILKDGLSNLQAMKSLGSDAAKVAKAAAIGNTTISTIESAQNAYGGMVKFIPGPVGIALGIAAAVTAGIAGAARVAQITSTSTGFKTGGYTGNTPEDQPAGTVHGGEFVMTAETVKRIGLPTLTAVQAGSVTLPNFAGSQTSAGLGAIAGSLQAMNSNMVNGAGMKQSDVFITANTDLISFEIQRREASNEVDKTGWRFDNV